MEKNKARGIALLAAGFCTIFITSYSNQSNSYVQSYEFLGPLTIAIGIIILIFSYIRIKNRDVSDVDRDLARESRRERKHVNDEIEREEKVYNDEKKEERETDELRRDVKEEERENSEFDRMLDDLLNNPLKSKIDNMGELLKHEKNNVEDQLKIENELSKNIEDEWKNQKIVQKEEASDANKFKDIRALEGDKETPEEKENVKKQLKELKFEHDEDEIILNDIHKLKKLNRYILSYNRQIIKIIDKQIKEIQSVNQKTKVRYLVDELKKLQIDKERMVQRKLEKIEEMGFEYSQIDSHLNKVFWMLKKEKRKDNQLRKDVRDDRKDPIIRMAA